MQAYQQNIRYPTHMLLTLQWYGPEWWLVEDKSYSCTGEQRAEVLDMTISVDVFNITNEGNFTNTSMNIVHCIIDICYIDYNYALVKHNIT